MNLSSIIAEGAIGRSTKVPETVVATGLSRANVGVLRSGDK